MPIGVTHHTTTIDDTTKSSYSTASITPAAIRLLIACWEIARGSSTNPSDPTVSGNGLTWSQIDAHLWITTGTVRRKLWIFAADTGAAPSAGAITFDHGASHLGARWSVFELSGTDLANSTLASLFVQKVKTAADPAAATSLSLALAAAGNSNNRPFLFNRHQAAEGTTPRANWTEIGEVGSGAESQWRSDAFETTASASWATSSPYAGIAFEIKALVDVKRQRRRSNLQAINRAANW